MYSDNTVVFTHGKKFYRGDHKINNRYEGCSLAPELLSYIKYKKNTVAVYLTNRHKLIDYSNIFY